ncbi:MAG: DMT family transporter [Candidatus Actinomarinales bacterium]|nr:MAG: DMT family transporter [Candidatus Actinomarinales bacterium]
MSDSNEVEKPTLSKTIAAIFCAAFMWGSGNVIARSLLIEGVNQIFLVTSRITLVGLLYLAYYLMFVKESFNQKAFKEAAVTGFVSVFTVGWSFIFALEYVSSGLVTLMVSSAPVFTIMWLKILLKEEEISRSKYTSIFIGFLGIAYLFISKETGLLGEGDIFLGGGLAFIGVQSIAIATVLNRKYAPSYKISTWLCYQYITIGALSLVAYLISGVGVSPLDTSQKIRLAVLVVFNISAYLSFTWLIQRVPALFAALVDYIVPVVGVTAGVIFLNESFNINIVIAAFFIFLSLYITTKDEFSN